LVSLIDVPLDTTMVIVEPIAPTLQRPSAPITTSVFIALMIAVSVVWAKWPQLNPANRFVKAAPAGYSQALDVVNARNPSDVSRVRLAMANGSISMHEYATEIYPASLRVPIGLQAFQSEGRDLDESKARLVFALAIR